MLTSHNIVISSALGEAGDRNLLILVNLEHGQELGDHQKFPDLFSQVQKFQLFSLAGDRSVRSHQFTNTSAIHIAHVRQVEDDLLPAILQKVADGVSNAFRSFAKGDFASDVQNMNIPDGACVDLHYHLLRSLRLTSLYLYPAAIGMSGQYCSRLWSILLTTVL